jgi:hypothetical protein
MNDKFLIPADASHEQSEIIIGALYLSLLFAFRHIANAEGAASAAAFKEESHDAQKRWCLDVVT